MALTQQENVSKFDGMGASESSEDYGCGAETRRLVGSWWKPILRVARHYRVDHSPENVRLAGLACDGAESSTVIEAMVRHAGLKIQEVKYESARITAERLPLVVELKTGPIAVIDSIDTLGTVTLKINDRKESGSYTREALDSEVKRLFVLRPDEVVQDSRVDDYIDTDKKSWLQDILLQNVRPYGHVLLATIAANFLALTGILFAMQVYDRVIPAESLPTLYVLFSGVAIALVFDFVLRWMRIRITDLLGKQADLKMSDRVFGRALRLKSSERPKSTGAFVSQIRELDRVRELLTSTTVTAMADIPFLLLFLLVFWVVAGQLVLVPLFAAVFMVLPGLLLQPRLKKLASASIRESSLRHATLMEAVQGFEDIKGLRSEQRFLSQWNQYNAVTAESSAKLRSLLNLLSVWSQKVQMSVFALVVLFGAPLVMQGEMTTGALIAASILGSRTMAPMAGVTQILNRWQQARVAMQGLDQIMNLPVDYPEGARLVHKPVIQGVYQFSNAIFQYDSEARRPALTVDELQIRPGEKVALLGKNGAGKSTLLQALSGLLEPNSGIITLDGVVLNQIDPADVRRDLSYLNQNARLFHGTLRENLIMGAPDATDEDLYSALSLSGGIDFVRNQTRGLDHVVLEGGLGLSGGQRQQLLLARLLVRDPRILLLDEPTASMDQLAEKAFIAKMSTWCKERTLIVATHRRSILSLVDRVIVVDSGRIIIDDSRDAALRALRRVTNESRRESNPAVDESRKSTSSSSGDGEDGVSREVTES